MDFIYKPLKELEGYDKIVNAILSNKGKVGIIGPSDSQKAHFSYALLKEADKRAIFVTYNDLQARLMYEDFTFFFGDDALLLPQAEYILYDIEAKSYETSYKRLTVLDKILDKDYKILIVSAEVLCQRLINPEKLINRRLEISLDSTIEMEDLTSILQKAGYERVEIVEGKGQFAVRGGILDVFPVNLDDGVRIDFFGDDIDSIRKFDVETQRSIENINSVRIIPAKEILFDEGEKENIIDKIIAEYQVQLDTFKNSDVDASVIRSFRKRLENDIDRFKSFDYFPGIDRYVPLIFDDHSTILDYAEDAIIILDEPGQIKQRINGLNLEHSETFGNMLSKGLVLKQVGDLYAGYDRFYSQLNKRMAIYSFNMNATSQEGLRKSNIYNFATKSVAGVKGKIEIVLEQVRQWKSLKYRIVILSSNKSRGERLCEIMKDYGIEAAFFENYPDNVEKGQVVVTYGALHKSFEYLDIGFVVLSDSEFFIKSKRTRRKSKVKGKKINVFTDLEIGDYVVHDIHGIGQYMGLEQITVSGVTRDYIKIKYADNGFLYVPTNQMDLIQKFIGSEGKAPKINKLGSNDWAKTKSRVKASLRELAEELLKIYAQREASKGFKFSPDTVWQKEFEEDFPYEETDDQIRCAEEIKRDMENDKPMERLLCGDVGYGKTEVALRAAFKAVMDNKQVAFLVPTTILAQQHYFNIKERMKNFPVNVDYICRFRTPAEQRNIKKRLAKGEIDILVGTHSILQKDVVFKDLGLLIVDEEQRFGVGDKEKFKKLKPNLDILTLSATPIPRTLHMSLVSIRDISIIEEPPEERYPVQTYVMEYNEQLIKDAIYREMARSGQVFYLYNKVKSIDIKAYELGLLIPEARIGVAHGQMSERELENIMNAFLEGEFDILVCTTIIESGIDMPNVNTIIVEDSDRLGLAQLYQIRGRVGRSNKMAFAYLTYKKNKQLTEESTKRLKAIKEFTEFGSGFKIAMRDMEIRGVGNLLGSKQHGHMENVGYDMYCKLLDKAVRELRGEQDINEEEEDSVTIDISIDAFIDRNYIPNEEERLEVYKKISLIENDDDIMDVIDELIDRYGDLPEEVSNLITVAKLKAIARSKGFVSVIENKGLIVAKFMKNAQINLESIGNIINKYKQRILFNAGAEPYIAYRITEKDKNETLNNILKIFQMY